MTAATAVTQCQVTVALDWTPNTNHAGRRRIFPLAALEFALSQRNMSDRARSHRVIASTGFYVALAQGLYRAANMTVKFLSPAQDAYKATPASRVASGQALLAVSPSETVISSNSQSASSTKPRLTVGRTRTARASPVVNLVCKSQA